MEPTTHLGRTLILLGLLLAGVGCLLAVFGGNSWLGNLPGDLSIEGDGYRIYIPLATCLVASVVLSLLFYLFNSIVK